MDTPYTTPVTPITDVDKYFRTDPKTGTMYFIGETLELRIPERYSVYDLLSVEDKVTTLGVLDMIIDGKYQFPLNLLVQFTCIPSEMSNMTYKNVPYLVLHLQKGDVFMLSTTVVQESSVIYALWVEFITRGKPIYTLSYRGLGLLFDKVKQCTGSGLGVGRPVFEAMIAFLSRDEKDPATQYRLTDMKKPMRLIAMRSVSLAPTGTIARINGSYDDEGFTAALRYQVNDNQPFEDVLRGLPQQLGIHPVEGP